MMTRDKHLITEFIAVDLYIIAHPIRRENPIHATWIEFAAAR